MRKTISQCINLSFAITQTIFLTYKVWNMDRTKFIYGDLFLILFLTVTIGLNIHTFINKKQLNEK